MADGKWIGGLKAATPLAEAARRVLEVRLQVVRKHLPRALEAPDDDREHVHQLRVGTRRAAAALRIFKGCLRRKGYDRAREVLRRLRRAAGAARDWDVFLDMLTGQLRKAKAAQKPGLDFLIGYARAQRDAAQLDLVETARRKQADVDRLIDKTLKAVRTPRNGEAVLVDLARPLLRGLVENLDKAVQADLTEYENLHQVRIAGKRLRYAMEVFASCFSRAFRDKQYAAVEELQEILGEANDSHVAALRLESLSNGLKACAPAVWQRSRAGIESVLEYHRRRLPEQTRGFEDWWQTWQSARPDGALDA